MATHSNILAWEIPWTEEPDGLQSMVSQRVGHDLVTKQHLQRKTSIQAFQVVLVVKNLPANSKRQKRLGFNSGSGRCPGGEPGNPLQYSCLENPMNRGTWQATVHGVTKSQTQLKRLSKQANSQSSFKNLMEYPLT